MATRRKFESIPEDDKRKIMNAQYFVIPERPDTPPLRAPNRMKWVPDWEMSDEFECDETTDWVNRELWEVGNSRWLGRPPAWFSKKNVFVHKETLYLRSREDERPPELNLPGEYHTFSTAFVRTKKTRLYGYFEIMCRLMDSDISSAFWFANIQGNLWTELDVFEYSTSDRKLPDNLHFNRLFATNCHVHRHPDKNVPNKYRLPKSYDIGFDLTSKRIKVGFNWQKDYITWYLNDVQIRRIKNEFFHQPLHLQIDSETFPFWFGLPEVGKNSLPDHFKIMYVRSWYLEDARAGPSSSSTDED